MDKKQIREQVGVDVATFLSMGGLVEIVKSRKVKVKHPATGKQKATFFKGGAPRGVPGSSWSF